MLGWGIAETTVFVLLGVAVFAAGIYTFVAFEKRASKKRSVQTFRQFSSRTPEQLDRDYKKAKDELSKQYAVIEVIHDLPEFSLGPAGLPTGIDFEQAYRVVGDIHAAKNAPLAIIIHTLGGYSTATDMIAKALNEHKGEKTAFVPYVAMSGGTIVALATQEVVMGKGARLGPIDTQYNGYPAGAWRRLVEKKDPNAMTDFSVLSAYVVERIAADETDRARKRIDGAHGPDVAAKLLDEKFHHSEAIYRKEAKDIGIRISEIECPKDVYTLVDCKLRLAAIEREQFVRRELQLRPTQSVMSSSVLHKYFGNDQSR